MSRPTRARGLKLRLMIAIIHGLMSRPMRARGLKLRVSVILLHQFGFFP